ncbi:SPRY domain-containing protein 7-like [Diadema setosum]|uniref:SPRY domain-containing protein 7-like n=1 Tax=Diadema antillarum TaxID=105358 RepID=UPI003A8A49BB
MAACFCCFRCFPWRAGFGSGHVPLKEIPTVVLDTSHMGNDVVIVKSGRRICGTGGALGNAPLVQDKAYFEMKLQSTGVWGIGLATRKSNLNRVPLGECSDSWVMRSDGTVCHAGDTLHKLTVEVAEGDVIGITYDHMELNFYKNGEALQIPVTGVKGTLYPAIYVDEGAILDVQFSEFYHTPPSGFDKIMFEQSLL